MMRAPHETKLAMFWVAAVVHCAGETHVTANRIVASLLRTNALRDLCSRAGIDFAGLLRAVDELETPSFAECERRVWKDLADQGIPFLSKENEARIERRPLDPALKPVFDAVFERYNAMTISPAQLLLDMIRADPALAERLAAHGLTAGAISAGAAAADR